jgi:hypothetical protein
MTFQWLLLKPKMGDYFYEPDGSLAKPSNIKINEETKSL